MRRTALLFIIVFQSARLFAQDIDQAFQKSKIAIGYYSEPKKNFSDSAGKYSFKQIFIRGSVPFFSKSYKNDELLKSKYIRLAWDAGAAFGFPDISFVNTPHQLNYFMTGLSGFYFNGAKSIWMGSLHTSVSEDNFSLSDPLFRFTGDAIYVHKSSKVFDYHIGIAYTYLFGNAYVLPVLGFRYHFNEKWKVLVTLPFRSSLTYRPNKSNDWEFFIAPAGSQSGFATNGLIDTAKNFVLRMRKQQYQTGVGWKFNKKPAVSFDLKAGLLLGRKLTFIDDQNNILSKTGIRNSGFISAAITYKFGKHSGNKSEKSQISDDLPDNFDPNDLE